MSNISMSNVACVITAAVDNGVRVAALEVCQIFAEELVKKGMLNCKPSEAMGLLEGMEITTKRSAAMKKVRAAQKIPDNSESKKMPILEKPDMVLPFCGIVEESWCKGVRFNHGLHTQCTNGPASQGEYCKTCQKSAENSASSKPTYGDIRDRAATGALEYRDPKGKLTTCYANVAKKMGLDLTRAEEVATALGWTIPAAHLVETATKRGRPGNPAEKKTVVKKAQVKKSTSMDDQIAQLVAEAAEEVLGAKPDELSAPAKKTIKVKAKKVKKVDPEKEAAKKEKAEVKAKKEAEKLVKQGEREAKKKAAAEAKAVKDAEKAAKAEAKAVKDAEKAAKDAEKAAKDAEKAEAKAVKDAEKLVKQGEREAKKKAAAEAKAVKDAAKAEAKAVKAAEKAAKDAEKLVKQGEREAKKHAAAEAKAAKDAEKAEAKAVKDAEKVAKDAAKAEAKAAKDAEKVKSKLVEEAAVVAVDSTDEELEEEVVVDFEAGVPDTGVPMNTIFGADSDGEDDEDVELDESKKVTIGEINYFKSPAYGLPAVLFSYPDGTVCGALDEETGEIQEIDFDEQ